MPGLSAADHRVSPPRVEIPHNYNAAHDLIERNLAAGRAAKHDMDAVFALADVITVMVEGKVLESGPPMQIRASVAVRQAYLGEGGTPPSDHCVSHAPPNTRLQ